MYKEIVIAVACVLLSVGGVCRASCPCPNQADANGTGVEAILARLKAETKKLETYQAQLDYKFIQPLLESQSLRKGQIYYKKLGDKSRLRINFSTLSQDEEEPQEYIEQYIFDGTWLTQINYQTKSVKLYQQAEPNEPTDAFELISRNFPIIGFSNVDELKEQFEIELVDPNKSGEFIEMKLKTKPESVYKDEYANIDFFVDKALYMPARIITVNSEGDIYEVKLAGAKVNQPVDMKIFEFEVPAGFGKPEIVPLKKDQ